MAQREKEETEFKVHETLTLCTNGCGFPGNPATNNMCQNCFKATGEILKPLNFSSSSSSQDNKPRSSSSRSSARSDSKSGSMPAVVRREPTIVATAAAAADAVSVERTVNRCSGCRRKVGLTGFRCRCGDLFCSEHRYSDRHMCSYDYKAAGREAISRENPVVKAAKIIRL